MANLPLPVAGNGLDQLLPSGEKEMPLCHSILFRFRVVSDAISSPRLLQSCQICGLTQISSYCVDDTISFILSSTSVGCQRSVMGEECDGTRSAYLQRKGSLHHHNSRSFYFLYSSLHSLVPFIPVLNTKTNRGTMGTKP